MALEEKDVFLNRQDIVGDAGFDPRTSGPQKSVALPMGHHISEKVKNLLVFFFFYF